MKEIPLRNGGVALVDDSDFEALSKFSWKRVTMNDGRLHYAHTYLNRKMVGMHRVILTEHLGGRLLVDHINGDGLNNTRGNIRVATYSENAKNTWRSRAGLPVRGKAAA